MTQDISKQAYWEITYRNTPVYLMALISAIQWNPFQQNYLSIAQWHTMKPFSAELFVHSSAGEGWDYIAEEEWDKTTRDTQVFIPLLHINQRYLAHPGQCSRLALIRRGLGLGTAPLQHPRGHTLTVRWINRAQIVVQVLKTLSECQVLFVEECPRR